MKTKIKYLKVPAWELENGTLIPIKDMDTSHIKQCIKEIKRTNTLKEYIPIFKEELESRKYLGAPPPVFYIDL